MVAQQLLTPSSIVLAAKAREHSLRMVHLAKASHIGSALSIVDILAVLYSGVLNVDPSKPDDPDRDRLLLSKGHAGVALYAILGEVGFFDPSEFDFYGQDGAKLMGHASHHVAGVELSTGSLGHALPVACGLATGLKNSRVFCILSDGELDEGSNWEAILFAGHHALANLVAIVDYNRIQSLGRVQDVLELEPLDAKFESFGWRTALVDGHDHDQIRFELLKETDHRPTVLIANTTKGKGVDFMEDQVAWHYRSPNEIQFQEAVTQVRI
jgi:transketolase